MRLGSAVLSREFFSFCLKMPLLPDLGIMDPGIPWSSVTWPSCLMSFRLTYHGAEFVLNLYAPFWKLTVAGGGTACMPLTLLTAPQLDWSTSEMLSLITASAPQHSANSPYQDEGFVFMEPGQLACSQTAKTGC